MRISDWSSDVCSSDLLVGHLAVFEMCSVGPMGRYRAALERLGFDEAATRFYSEHVLADERHQVVALHEMAAQLVEQEPMLGGEVIFGAKRSEEHTSELQSLMRISYAVFCLNKKKKKQ